MICPLPYRESELGSGFTPARLVILPNLLSISRTDPRNVRALFSFSLVKKSVNFLESTECCREGARARRKKNLNPGKSPTPPGSGFWMSRTPTTPDPGRGFGSANPDDPEPRPGSARSPTRETSELCFCFPFDLLRIFRHRYL